MENMRRKLNNQDGAVMVIALMFFLVCVVVAAIVITAATMNAGRTENRYDEQTAYFATSSAVQLLQENFAGMTFSAEREEWEYRCFEYGHDDSEHSSPLEESGMHEWVMTKACDESVYLNEFITETAMTLCEHEYSPSVVTKYIKEYTFEADNPDDVTTTVSVEMLDGDEGSEKYDIKCIVTSKAKQGSTYTMSLHIDAVVDNTQSSKTYKKADTHVEDSTTDKEWDKALGEYVPVKVNVDYDYTVTTYRQTVTWSKGTIEKGGGGVE